MKTYLKLSVYFLVSILSACSNFSQQDTATTTLETMTSHPQIKAPDTAEQPSTEAENIDLSIAEAYYTFPSKDGNHYVHGTLDLKNGTPLEITTNGTPQWLVGAPYLAGTIWVTALTTGEVQAFYVHDNSFEEIPMTTKLEAGEPPAIVVAGDKFWLIQGHFSNDSTLTHPFLTNAGDLGTIDSEGNLEFDFFDRTFDGTQADLNAIPDARVIETSDGRLILLTEATPRYDHGIAGDSLEAGAFAIITIQNGELSIQETTLPESLVIEGILPISADLDGDGNEEIIVTHSGFDIGAQLAVYDAQGLLVATSEAIGNSYRWRHQIAVAPFGVDGTLELVDVLTPHLGGVVEFFQWQGDDLVRVATVEGFTSHRSGSRNMDMVLAGDFDNDGLIELLLPNQSLNSLGAIERTESGAIVDWIIELNSQLSSNLSAITLDDGTIALGLGLEKNQLIIWSP